MLRPIAFDYARAVALISILVVGPGTPSHAQPPESTAGSTSSGFGRVRNFDGWTLPPLGRELPVRPCPIADLPEGLEYTTFEGDADTPLLLPWYHMEDGVLVLLHLEFQVAPVWRVRVDGKPFAYLAAARGRDAGVSGWVAWVDEEGSGRFTRFEWTQRLSSVPSWVSRLLEQRGANHEGR